MKHKIRKLPAVGAVALALAMTACHPATIEAAPPSTVSANCLDSNLAGGVMVVVDGIFGPITESLVLDFQRRDGLTEDGILNSGTWMHLAGNHVIEQGDRGGAVKALQYLLVNLYGYNLAVDGEFGPATRAVVVDFQEANLELYKVGVVAGWTRDTLMYGP